MSAPTVHVIESLEATHELLDLLAQTFRRVHSAENVCIRFRLNTVQDLRRITDADIATFEQLNDDEKDALRGLRNRREDEHRMHAVLESGAWRTEEWESRLDGCEKALRKWCADLGLNGRCSVEASSFQRCVEQATEEVLFYLRVHRGDVQLLPAAAVPVYAYNTLNAIKGVKNQVRVVFPLVTLLYVTFDVAVPDAESRRTGG